jgi:hypothetical protein
MLFYDGFINVLHLPKLLKSTREPTPEVVQIPRLVRVTRGHESDSLEHFSSLVELTDEEGAWVKHAIQMEGVLRLPLAIVVLNKMQIVQRLDLELVQRSEAASIQGQSAYYPYHATPYESSCVQTAPLSFGTQARYGRQNGRGHGPFNV